MNIDFKNISTSKKTKIVISAAVAVVIVLSAFQAGMFVGYKKAAFSYKMSDRYYRQTFGGNRQNGPDNFFGNDLPGGNGAVGKIVNINIPHIVVDTPDNIEKIIKIDDDTLIRQSRDTISVKDLKIGDYVIVLGSPDDKAEIEARLIRLLPPPPADTNMSTTTLQATSSQQ